MRRVGHMQAEFLLLVHVATAVGAHVVEDVGTLGVEGHHGEVGVLLHELVRIARWGHIHGDGVDVFAPKVAESAPADGHGVVVDLVTHGEQGTMAFEHGERVALEVGDDVKLAKSGVVFWNLGRGFALGLCLVAAAAQGDGCQDEGSHNDVFCRFHCI